MRTKAEIEEIMNDHITLADCFSGEVVSEKDSEYMRDIHLGAKRILTENQSVTVQAKLLFDEVLKMDFTEHQWFCLVLTLSMQFDIGKAVGARDTLAFLREMQV